MRIQVKVIPNSQSEGLRQEDDTLVIRVRTSEVDEEANAAVINMVAKGFGVSPRAVRIVAGHRSLNKIVEVEQ